jgi:hypothetical protein
MKKAPYHDRELSVGARPGTSIQFKCANVALGAKTRTYFINYIVLLHRKIVNIAAYYLLCN